MLNINAQHTQAAETAYEQRVVIIIVHDDVTKEISRALRQNAVGTATAARAHSWQS